MRLQNTMETRQRDWIEITESPIEVWKVLSLVVSDRAGAVVHFIGTVREEPNIRGLYYECYERMAVRLLEEIVFEARKRWVVEKVSIVHRIGWLEVGEPSVVIAVSAAHRREAFAACQFVIDQIKEVAPIWKKELPDTVRRFNYAENQ